MSKKSTLENNSRKQKTSHKRKKPNLKATVLSWAKLIGGGEVAARTEAVSTAKTAVSCDGELQPWGNTRKPLRPGNWLWPKSPCVRASRTKPHLVCVQFVCSPIEKCMFFRSHGYAMRIACAKKRRAFEHFIASKRAWGAALDLHCGNYVLTL